MGRDRRGEEKVAGQGSGEPFLAQNDEEPESSRSKALTFHVRFWEDLKTVVLVGAEVPVGSRCPVEAGEWGGPSRHTGCGPRP